MANIIDESYYYMKYFMRNKIKSRNPESDWIYRHYTSKPYWDIAQLNHTVASLITAGTPFMMGRFGAVEMFNMRTVEFNRRNKLEKSCEQLYTCAGFFPNDTSLIPRFCETMKAACHETDILGIWQTPCEDYFIEKYCDELMATCQLRSLEPWWYDNPWSAALKGKKVLVIHPFEDSVKKQYQNHSLLFSNASVLPDFKLLTLKAVQTAGNQTDTRFSDWFEALDWMCRQCDQMDFDIALIGCGAYGFPLAAHIKRSGRQAVHFGGSLQILFGIKGDRWDRFIPDVVAMYNENWHYPLDTETPKGHHNIEGGTYWKKES